MKSNLPNCVRRSHLSFAARLAVMLFLVGAGEALAAVRYVDVNSANPAAPYTAWETAARTIRDAIDAAVGGDEIVVTNGTYFAPILTNFPGHAGTTTFLDTNAISSPGLSYRVGVKGQ